MMRVGDCLRDDLSSVRLSINVSSCGFEILVGEGRAGLPNSEGPQARLDVGNQDIRNAKGRIIGNPFACHFSNLHLKSNKPSGHRSRLYSEASTNFYISVHVHF